MQIAGISMSPLLFAIYLVVVVYYLAVGIDSATRWLATQWILWRASKISSEIRRTEFLIGHFGRRWREVLDD